MEGRKHNSGLDNNDTDERLERGHQTHPSFVRRIPAKSVYGTPEEVGGRVGGTMKSLPDRNAARFRQKGPASSGGQGNMNDQLPKKYGSGTTTKTKFGNPNRYS